MQLRDAGLVLPGVPHGECGTRGRQAVPLHLAQLDHQVGLPLLILRQCTQRGRQAIPYGERPCGHRGSRERDLYLRGSAAWRSRNRRRAIAILAMLGHGQDARGTPSPEHCSGRSWAERDSARPNAVRPYIRRGNSCSKNKNLRYCHAGPALRPGGSSHRSRER
jgi:hypothetical protein